VRKERKHGYGGYDVAVAKATGGRRRANVVNPDPCASIYSGVHRVRPLRLLPPYDAHRNSSIPITLRKDRTGFFANGLSNDLNSEFSHQPQENVTRSPW
jgi:hypothetical protein